MRRGLIFLTVFLFLYVIPSYGQEDVSVELKGISIGMRKSVLIDSWGYPSKREVKNKVDVWYYTNENTPHPTDGILVYFQKGKIENWSVVDNIYEEMNIWGKEAGVSP